MLSNFLTRAGLMLWQLGGDTYLDGLVEAIYAEKLRLK